MRGMGGGLFVFPILAAGFVVLIVFVAWITWAESRASEREIPDDMPRLEYEVPVGQDPVVVLTALGRAGYVTSTDHIDHQRVRIACPGGIEPERAHVRTATSAIHTTAISGGMPMDPGQVRFIDES